MCYKTFVKCNCMSLLPTMFCQASFVITAVEKRTNCYILKMHLKKIFLCLQEMIDCKNVSVLINPRDSLPTISAERCESIRFHLVRPGAMGSVYSVQCRDVSVHFKPPHREEYVLELPGEGVEEGGRGQFVSYLSGENMVTERVVRGTQ